MGSRLQLHDDHHHKAQADISLSTSTFVGLVTERSEATAVSAAELARTQ